MSGRRYSAADRLLMGLEASLRGFSSTRARHTGRPNPAAEVPPSELPEAARRHAAGLMRVNHAGEVAAQALYHGQAAMAADLRTREHLLDAAAEETDHLIWCEQRLAELGERPSALSPLWYAGSWSIGAIAGLAGDRWSLGFVAETERQVIEHLDGHLEQLPAEDHRSRHIVEQMRADEDHHRAEALAARGRELPSPVRRLMRLTAKLMTFGAYRI